MNVVCVDYAPKYVNHVFLGTVVLVQYYLVILFLPSFPLLLTQLSFGAKEEKKIVVGIQEIYSRREKKGEE